MATNTRRDFCGCYFGREVAQVNPLRELSMQSTVKRRHSFTCTHIKLDAAKNNWYIVQVRLPEVDTGNGSLTADAWHRQRERDEDGDWRSMNFFFKRQRQRRPEGERDNSV